MASRGDHAGAFAVASALDDVAQPYDDDHHPHHAGADASTLDDVGQVGLGSGEPAERRH